MNKQKTIALIITIAAFIGLIDSFYLVTEYFAALATQGAPTPCSPSSLVSCTKTVQGEWAHLLGVSNPLFGMLWYGLFTFYGLARVLDSTFSKYTRTIVSILALLGIIFSYTLYGGSVLDLRGVCPFCLTSTLLSTVVLFSFILDDRTYANAIFTNAWLPCIYILQAISLLAYGIGLPLFLAINIPLLLKPVEAMTHWSFPVMIVLIIGMWVLNYWTWTMVHVPMMQKPKKSWWQKLLRK